MISDFSCSAYLKRHLAICVEHFKKDLFSDPDAYTKTAFFKQEPELLAGLIEK